MVNYEAFSALRLSRIFPADVLESHRFYIEVDPEGDFDTEYLGGQWHEETIDGVQFFFPAADGHKLGVVELWASPYFQGGPTEEKPKPEEGIFVPSWKANADGVLEALALPFRMGASEATVRALAAGDVRRFGFPDEWYGMYPKVAKGTLHSLTFASRVPDAYHMQAVVHTAEGLLKLEIRRPDVVRANDSEGAYDACSEGMYDEGPG
jgi:hypothetical protein